jgi:hypothetical protein
MPHSLEFGPDIPDDELYGVDHHVNAANDPGVQLSEAYIRRDVACHFHLGVYIGGKGHSHDLCADFQALWGLGGSETPDGAVNGNPILVDAEYRSGTQRWVEHPMFVPVGEVAEGFDGSTRMVRSLVGLRATNDCPLRKRDFVEMSPLLREPLASVLNRELDLIAQPFGFPNAEMVTAQGEKQVFKSAPEIVNSVSQDEPDLEPPILWHCCEPKDVIARLRVELGVHVEEFGFSAQDGTNYSIQSFAMLLRPLNLGSALSKVNRHD